MIWLYLRKKSKVQQHRYPIFKEGSEYQGFIVGHSKVADQIWDQTDESGEHVVQFIGTNVSSQQQMIDLLKVLKPKGASFVFRDG